MEKATFGMGCFWSPQVTFSHMKGVTKTTVGYMGGTIKNPTYDQVCSGDSGHVEVVQIEFDPKITTYQELLMMFWSGHDPTQKDRQGPDVGAQYASVIFYHNAKQKKIAEESKKMAEVHRYKKPIVTRIEKAGPFYPAEEFHQNFLEKRGLRTCGY